MDFKRLALFSGAALVALALWLAWFCQPERQVRRHTAVLLKAVERRNWEKVKNLMADGYGDRWQYDKAFFAETLPVGGQALNMSCETPLMEV
jgi:hypothetical protein